MKRRLLPAIAALAIAVCSCVPEDPFVPDTPPEPAAPAEYSLENLTVRAYLNFLERLPYRDGDYSYSYIDEYYRLTTSYRKDLPAPVSIQWETAAGGGSQRVYVADNPDYEDALTYSVSGSSTSYDIYNLIPGKHYYWKVTSTAGDAGTGEFLTTGRRRFLKVDKVCNIRDLGGIPTADGTKRIKYGMIFRGGEMNGYHKDYEGRFCRIDKNGIQAMEKLGIKAILDLRTDSEAVDITVSPLGEGTDYIRFTTANQFYYDKCWNSDVYIDAFQWAIDELRKGKPVFFHCIFGADRTGTLAFLMEALLGVGENQLAIDYELTSFSYGLETPPRRRGPKNELSVYRYRQMLEGLINGPGTIQYQVRTFLSNKISDADLDWFISSMLEDIPD
ncbi:MAG: tyrosine-protein phosphatase [Bacteroidales bacterium]|nr:tyrosine-protein phosphatase [Bacteroidales bacterium]